MLCMAFAGHRRGGNGRAMADSAIRSQDGCRSFNVTESRSSTRGCMGRSHNRNVGEMVQLTRYPQQVQVHKNTLHGLGMGTVSQLLSSLTRDCLCTRAVQPSTFCFKL
jgi:hypothetical protein